MKPSRPAAVYPRMTILLRALFVALLCATAIAASLAGGCSGQFGPAVVRGSGAVKTETRDATGFSEVRLTGDGDLVIEQTGAESLAVEAEENLLPLLETDVRDGVLYLGVKPGVAIDATRPVRYRVTAKDLTRIGITGSGKCSATKLSTGRLTADVSGSGRAVLAGRADDVDLRISGSGSFDAGGLRSKSVRVSISGSGSATVNAADQLEANISGSGSVRYAGDPRVQQRISGSGVVARR